MVMERFLVNRLFLVLLLCVSALAGPAWADRDEKLTPQDRYELGQRYMKRGYYTKAMEQFNRIRNYHRDDPYAVKAELAIADLHYKKAEWDQARLAYEDFQRFHPTYEELDYVVYRVGYCLWKKASIIAARDQSWTRQSVNSWSAFELRYSDSPYLEEVTDLLQQGRNRLAHKEFIIARFYFKRDAWQAAVGRLEDMLRVYPRCDDRARALAMLAECYARQGDWEQAEKARARLSEVDGHGAVRRLKRLDSRLKTLRTR